MAYAYVAGRGGANNKTSSATLAGSPSAAIAIGQMVVVIAACDNASTGDAETTLMSVSDNVGNTYTKLGEYTNGDGAAGAGVTTGLFASKLTTALATTDTITLTLTSAVGTRAMVFQEFSGAGINRVGRTYGVADVATSGPSLTVSGLPATEHLWLGVDGTEGLADTYTRDADYSSAGVRSTTGGNADTNIAVWGGYRIAALASDTYQSSNTVARDWASMLVAIDEVPPAVFTPEPPKIHGQQKHLTRASRW